MDASKRIRSRYPGQACGNPGRARALAGCKAGPGGTGALHRAVKLGFFVLAVDAFGAGERGVGKALGEYHGEMTAATLLPVGLPLSGVQVYENMRAWTICVHDRKWMRRNRITGASGVGIRPCIGRLG